MADFEKKTQFEYVYDALAQKYPGLVAPAKQAIFQFAAAPLAATWIKSNDSSAYSIANAVPVTLDGFYNIGSVLLDKSYASLIMSLPPRADQDNAKYLALLRRLNNIGDSLTALNQDIDADYQVWSANNRKSDGTVPKTRIEWLATEGIGWQTKLDNLNAQVEEVKYEKTRLVQALDAALTQALKNLDIDQMNISYGGTSQQVPMVNIGGKLADDKTRWDVYPKDQYDFDVRINKNMAITNPWQTLVETRVTSTCWSTNVSTTVDTFRIINDVNYDMRVTAKGLQAYQITRGKWYDGSLVQPTAQIPDGSTYTNDSFFGLSGALHLIPDLIVVWYKPNIELTVSTDVYKQELEAKADVSIQWVEFLGVRYQVKGISSLQPVQNANNTTTVRFNSPDSAVPQILGVKSEVKWNGNK